MRKQNVCENKMYAKTRVTEKYRLDLLVTIVATLQDVRINVYFILNSESSLYVLSYRSIRS